MAYIDDHPTSFEWRSDVQQKIGEIQNKYPWLTFINTYWWHPPYDPPVITKRYDKVSFDVWGGGKRFGKYAGYRGKRLPRELGARIFRDIFYDPHPPNIYWCIYQGKMWVAGEGWQPAPWGPPDSDPDHRNHIHVTYY